MSVSGWDRVPVFQILNHRLGGLPAAQIAEHHEWQLHEVRHHLRADPGGLWMIAVDGDSMEPTVSSGDHILIDASRTVPAPPGIFVIWDGIALVAKRIEHVPHSEPPRLVLKSLNPEYDSHECFRRGDPRRRAGGLGCQEAVEERNGGPFPTTRGATPHRATRYAARSVILGC